MQNLLAGSTATYWSNKLPYFKFCKRFGWTMTSKMPQRYIDRDGVDELEVAKIYHDQDTAKLAKQNQELQAELAALRGMRTDSIERMISRLLNNSVFGYRTLG